MWSGRVIIGWLLAGLWLLNGCVGAGHESTQIPPPYTTELSQNREDAQLAFLTNCIRNRVDLANSYYQRARVYAGKNDFGAALSDINLAISAKDNVGEYYLLRGKIHRELNHLDAAMQDVERAEALQQNDPQLYVLMADILQERNKINEASRYLKAILTLAPYDASAHYVQGMLEFKTGDTLAGLASIEKALELNPRLFRGYRTVSQLYLSQNNFQKANGSLHKGLEFFPQHPELLLELARFYKSINQPDSSLVYYQQLRNKDRHNLDLAAETADACIRNRNYQEALHIYEEIQSHKPDYPLINYYIGFCHEKLWRWNTAKSYYAKELEQTPGSPEARSGIWRITQLENERLEASQSENGTKEPSKTLDDSRLNITPIQPRKIQD